LKCTRTHIHTHTLAHTHTHSHTHTHTRTHNLFDFFHFSCYIHEWALPEDMCLSSVCVCVCVCVSDAFIKTLSVGLHFCVFCSFQISSGKTTFVKTSKCHKKLSLDQRISTGSQRGKVI